MGTLMRMKDAVQVCLMIRVAAQSRHSNRQVEGRRERVVLFEFPNLELGRMGKTTQRIH